MNGKKARLLRKLVYPGDMSSRARTYKTIRHERRRNGRRLLSGQMICDNARRGYQRLKRACKGIPARTIIADPCCGGLAVRTTENNTEGQRERPASTESSGYPYDTGAELL